MPSLFKTYRAKSHANLTAAFVAGCAVVALVPFAAAFDPSFQDLPGLVRPAVEHIELKLNETCREAMKTVGF